MVTSRRNVGKGVTSEEGSVEVRGFLVAGLTVFA
jgi:hypothetical protein